MFGKKEIVQSGKMITGSIKADSNYIEAYYKLSGNSKTVRAYFKNLIYSPQPNNDIFKQLGLS